MVTIELNKIGRIVKGEHPGWLIQIVHDPDKTGGYYIFYFKSTDPNDPEGFDDWVETYEDLGSFFSDDWEIDWRGQ